MKYKVAFASSDGKMVNQHFGKAKAFHIVEVDEEKKEYQYLETRENKPCCNNFEHSDEDLDNSVRLINDCVAVFVLKAGRGAQIKLFSQGIKAIEAPYFIYDILDELIGKEEENE